jgi:hypothetical protein
MPGTRKFTYKFHVVAPELDVDKKCCTYRDIVALLHPKVEGGFTPKNCYRVVSGFYSKKFAGITITKIHEPRPVAERRVEYVFAD